MARAQFELGSKGQAQRKLPVWRAVEGNNHALEFYQITALNRFLPWHSRRVVTGCRYVFQQRLSAKISCYCDARYVEAPRPIDGVKQIKKWRQWRCNQNRREYFQSIPMKPIPKEKPYRGAQRSFGFLLQYMELRMQKCRDSILWPCQLFVAINLFAS